MKNSLKKEETKVKILERLAELKKKTEPENGKKKKITRKGLCTNANKIIYSNLSTIFKYKIPEEGKISFEYWVDTTAEETFRNSFGKIPIFTDLHDSSSADIARTYFAKNLVEEDFKFLKDKLLIPVPPFFMRKDGRISSLVVEEMNPIQAKLFSRLELSEFLV